MPKKSANAKAADAWQATYDLPDELDLKRLRVVGVGMESLRKHAAAKRRTVELEPDIAKAFPTAQAVNDGLRTLGEIRELLQASRPRKIA